MVSVIMYVSSSAITPKLYDYNSLIAQYNSQPKFLIPEGIQVQQEMTL